MFPPFSESLKWVRDAENNRQNNDKSLTLLENCDTINIIKSNDDADEDVVFHTAKNGKKYAINESIGEILAGRHSPNS